MLDELKSVARARAFGDEPPRTIDQDTGEVVDRAVPPGEPAPSEKAAAELEIAERAALIKSIKDISAKVTITKEDRDSASRTYLGEGGTLAKADLAGLVGLRDWLRTRAAKG